MAKLTLHVPDNLVVAAKKEAASRNTSVSRLVSDYFRAFAASRPDSDSSALPPITSRLIGCIAGADADKESYIDHLERKHS